MCVSLLLTCILMPKRKPEDKEDAVKVWRTLIEKVGATLEGEQHVLLRGSTQYGAQEFFARFHHGGKVDSRLWSQELDTLIKPYWNQALIDPRCCWVTSHFENPHVADVILFSLMPIPAAFRRNDADNLRTFQRAMEKPMCFMIGFLARQLEKHIVSVTQPPNHSFDTRKRQIMQTGNANKRQRISTTTCYEIVAKALDKLYAKEVVWND